MAMTVTKRKDSKLPSVFEHKIADIRGGVSVSTAALSGDYLHEGTPLSAPIKGICHVVKTAQVVETVGASATTIKVNKRHHFMIGDHVLIDEKAKAATITEIDTTDKTFDIITVSAALGKIKALGSIAEAKNVAESNTSELKYIPLSLVGTGKVVNKDTNLNTDAWLIGTTRNNNLPAVVTRYLTGIINF